MKLGTVLQGAMSSGKGCKGESLWHYFAFSVMYVSSREYVIPESGT